MDFLKKNRERKRTIGKSEPRRMEPKIDEAALDAKIAAIRESNRHFFFADWIYFSTYQKEMQVISWNTTSVL